MNESVKKAKFMEKPFALAKASRQHIERFWKIGAEVSKFGASIASFFSSIHNTLAKAVMQIVGFSKGIHELSLTRVMFLPSFDLWSRRVTPPEEEYFPTEMGRANVSFLFNVTVARKTAARLARGLAVKTPRSTLLLELAPSEAEFVEETIEKPVVTMPRIDVDLQSRFESKLAPSIKGISEGFQEYSRKAIFPSLLTAMHRRLLAVPASPEGLPSHTLVAPPEKEATQVDLLERPLPAVSQVSLLPPKEAKIEPSPLSSIPVKRLTQEVVSSLQYAAKLPSIVLERAIPILKRMAAFSVVALPKPPPPSLSERPLPVVSKIPSLPYEEAKIAPPPLISIPFMRFRPEATRPFEYAAGLPNIFLERAFPILKTTAAFSTVSPPKPSLPSTEPSYRHHRPTTLPPMHPSLTSPVLEEISPSLTSWIYEVSEILRGTTLSLSAVPVAASTAEKVVTEALIQPIPSFEAPKTLGTQEPVSPVLTSSGPETGVGRAEVEAFRLPALITSLIVALNQRYPFLLSESTVGETYGPSFELTRLVPEETPALGRMPEEKSFSKLPTVIALAAAESLIAQRLHQEFSGLIRQMQVARSSSGERLSRLSPFAPFRPTILGKLATAAPTVPLSQALERYAPGISSPSRSVRLESVSPAIQNTFNITVSAESAEEDLRDLENKISRILSEQIRRLYGSPRV